MGKVTTELSVSLDGFVAGPNATPEQPLGENGGEQLFAWYDSGDVELVLPHTDMVFHVSQVSADLLAPEWAKQGAMVTGRSMFDIAEAWGGNPPGGAPCFVVTHDVPQEWVKQGSPFIFVTDGVESAISQAKEVAGDKDVSVSSASIMQQAIKAGLLDEVRIDLVPVMLGAGVRMFDNLGDYPIQLEQIKTVQAPAVTHLWYRIVK
jgi:dihydrofolate reductase